MGFSGINRDVSTFLNMEGELREGQNVVTKKIGVLEKSGDYEIKGADMGGSILGGVDWLRADGTHTHLVASDGESNADIYEYVEEEPLWTAASQSLTAGVKVRFGQSPSLDTLFAANYSDVTRSYNGTSWSTSTNVTDCPKAKFVIEFGARIYVLNCYITATAYPTRAYRSSLVSAGSITWDTTNDWVTFDDVITGVGKCGENLFVGCQDGIKIFTLDDEKYQISSHGCVSHESIVSYGSSTFWASYDGIYITDGGSDKKISLPIQEYWDEIYDLNGIRMAVKGNYLYASLGEADIDKNIDGTMEIDGRNIGYPLFVYDILKNDWNRLNLGTLVKYLQTVSETVNILEMAGTDDPISEQKLFFGNAGEVFQLFASETQNTAAFSSYIETAWFDGSDAKYKDTFYELWGFGKRLSGMKVSYKLDNDENDWVSAGEFNGSIASVNFKAQGNRIKFLLEEYSKNNMWELERLDIGFTPAYVPKKLEEI